MNATFEEACEIARVTATQLREAQDSGWNEFWDKRRQKLLDIGWTDEALCAEARKRMHDRLEIPSVKKD